MYICGVNSIDLETITMSNRDPNYSLGLLYDNVISRACRASSNETTISYEAKDSNFIYFAGIYAHTLDLKVEYKNENESSWSVLQDERDIPLSLTLEAQQQKEILQPFFFLTLREDGGFYQRVKVTATFKTADTSALASRVANTLYNADAKVLATDGFFKAIKGGRSAQEVSFTDELGFPLPMVYDGEITWEYVENMPKIGFLMCGRLTKFGVTLMDGYTHAPRAKTQFIELASGSKTAIKGNVLRDKSVSIIANEVEWNGVYNYLIQNQGLPMLFVDTIKAKNFLENYVRFALVDLSTVKGKLHTGVGHYNYSFNIMEII